MRNKAFKKVLNDMANMCILKFLDEILESLRDSQWHSLGEIRTQISTSLPMGAEDTSNKIISMLEEQEFISIDKESGRAKIKPLGLKFLGLPPEN